MKKLKKIPEFKSEEEEREFWHNNDSIDFLDWNGAKEASFPNLKPTTKSISIRLPEMMIDAIKNIANKTDVPYQSLIKIFLKERLEQEKLLHKNL